MLLYHCQFFVVYLPHKIGLGDDLVFSLLSKKHWIPNHSKSRSIGTQDPFPWCTPNLDSGTGGSTLVIMALPVNT